MTTEASPNTAAAVQTAVADAAQGKVSAPVLDVSGRRLEMIPIAKIRENKVALRAVNRTTEDYKQLTDSIRRVGVLTAISVREKTDPESKETFYELLDGLQRFSASKDAGRDTIPAQVLTASQAEAMEMQVIANAQRIETKPVEYSNQLKRLLNMNPTMTEAELAARLSKSPEWIGERLGLVNLNTEIGKLVDDGLIPLSNAYALSKLPPEEQKNYISQAQTQPAAQFVPTISARVKEIRDAKRKGRDAAPAQFVAVARLQKLADIKSELDQSAPTITNLIKKNKIKDPVQAAVMTLKWALHLDDDSIAADKARDEQRKKDEAAAKEKRKAEREAQKAKEAAQKAEDAKAEPIKV